MKDIKRAWDSIFNCLWWPGTKLIYDYRSGRCSGTARRR